MSLTAELLKEFEEKIESLELVPSDDGKFEVSVDGDLIYSKLATKRHAEDGEIQKLLRTKIRAG